MHNFKGTYLLLAITSILLLLSGCNKDLNPIVLNGEWDLDTANVKVWIVYSPPVAEAYPETVKFLDKNLNKIRGELKKPQKIVFKRPNTCEFFYNEVPLPVKGSFVQNNAYFTISNAMFPNGLSGASDNIRIDLYYEYDYLMDIFKRFLTDEDDPPEVYERLIEKFEGVGSYKKSRSL